MIDRRQAGSGLMRRGGRGGFVSVGAADPMADLIAEFGARVVSAAEAQSAYIATPGGAVSGWTARAGASYEQATSARRPTHTVSDANFNGLGSVDFDSGDTEYLDGNGLATALSGDAVTQTIAFLMRYTGGLTSSTDTIIGYGRASSGTPIFELVKTNTAALAINHRNDAGGVVTRTTSQTMTQDACVIVLVKRSTTYEIHRNGTQLTLNNSAAQAGQTTIDRCVLSARTRAGVVATHASIAVPRILVLNDDASSGEIATITEKLAQGSGIVL